MNDEQEIRDVVDTWLEASRTGDVDTILSLMTDDVLFMLPGKERFGKEAFRAAANQAPGARLESKSEIREIKVLGEWAYLRNYLEISIQPPGKPAVHHSGYTLTILRKSPEGKWQLTR